MTRRLCSFWRALQTPILTLQIRTPGRVTIAHACDPTLRSPGLTFLAALRTSLHPNPLADPDRCVLVRVCTNQGRRESASSSLGSSLEFGQTLGK